MQARQISEAKDFSVFSVLQCPKCESHTLHQDSDKSSISCRSCQQSYPLLSFGDTSLPFLFSDVSTAVYDWCARIRGFNKKITEEINSLAEYLKDKTLSKLTRERMKQQLNAKKQYQAQILNHLQCFDQFQTSDSVVENAEIAKNQGVDSYINNIFRDWCWENDENKELIDALDSVIEKNFNPGLTVTLGAGVSRLSYDFHKKYKAEHSVLIDINPVLLGYAKRILNNEKIKLNEFPIAPESSADFCVEQVCSSNEVCANDDFTLLLADALNAPLKQKVFDTVLTPWFIDIVPIDFKDLISHVSRLLKPGGVWVNTGSLAFFHKNEKWNYSQEEIVDLLKKFGFSNIKVNRKKINYLHSPHSAHGRVENVFNFYAQKKFDSIPAKRVNYLPEWVENTSLAIPQQANITAISSKYLLQAQVLAAVDGQRSILEIGHLLAKQYSMSQQQAIAAVRQIFIDNL